MKIILDSKMLDYVEYFPNEKILIAKFKDKVLKSGKLSVGKIYKYMMCLSI